MKSKLLGICMFAFVAAACAQQALKGLDFSLRRVRLPRPPVWWISIEIVCFFLFLTPSNRSLLYLWPDSELASLFTYMFRGRRRRCLALVLPGLDQYLT